MAAKDISLVGATFYAVPQVDLPISGGGTASFVEISDTTATAADVASGKYFYTSAGVKTEGTASGGGGDPWSWMGKNPTKVKDYGTTKTYLKDTSFNTWTPTTTSTKLSDAANVSSSYVGDKSLYDYVIFTQMHTHFEYTGGQEARKITDYYANYFCDVYGYENNLTNITSGTNGYMAYQSDNIRAGIFYINSSGVAAYSVSNGSGVFMYATANPTVVASSSTITPKIPQINAACSNTLFNTTNAAAVNKNTSYYELSVQIWRVDKGTTNNGKMQTNIRDMWLNGIS